MNQLQADIKNILIPAKRVQSIVDGLAAEISRDYQGKNLVLLGILKGSVVFMGDLMKKVTIPVQVDFMRVSSYGGGTTSTGKINIILDLMRKDIDKCDILVIEDIIDSGNTLSYLTKYLAEKGAKSVKTCTLLDKPMRREIEFKPDYVGAEIPDEFVVGYGLDYDEDYRALPYIGILKPEVYENK